MVMVEKADAVAAVADSLGDRIATDFAAFLVDGEPYQWDYTAEELSEGLNPSCSCV